MDQPVLVHTEIDESAERRDIADCALEQHAGHQVADLAHCVVQARGQQQIAQVVCEHLDRHRLAPLFERAQVGQALLEFAQRDVVQPAVASLR